MEKSKLESMKKDFEKKGLDYATFVAGDESRRKRILKEDYDEGKTKYGWQYDQPIVAEESTTKATTAEDKEQAAFDKKAEKLAEKESEESSRYTTSKKRY
jgi:hypothetical protein